MTFIVVGKTYEIYVDASEQMCGLASPEAALSVDFPELLKDENIVAKEAFAIHEAIRRAPEYSCLRIYSDSKVCIAAFKKRICVNEFVLMLM